MKIAKQTVRKCGAFEVFESDSKRNLGRRRQECGGGVACGSLWIRSFVVALWRGTRLRVFGLRSGEETGGYRRRSFVKYK
jgi:hypothetical protein